MLYAVIIVYVLALAAALSLSAAYYAHMFQLESYLPVQFLKWLASGLPWKKKGAALFVAAFAVTAFALFPGRPAAFTAGAAAFTVSAFFFRPVRGAKKPLVVTSRVKRLFAAFAVLCALAGILCAVWNLVVLTPLFLPAAPFILLLANVVNRPVERAVRRYYINDAKKIIKARGKTLTVIGITGSYGKTSTKFFLAKLLSQKYNVLMTPASYNTTMGVVKVVREMLKPSHEIFICEMGARRAGEIGEICDIVLPDHGIITSIGPQHLETFKSIETIIRTKFELADAVGDRGVMVLNGDNRYIYERRYNVNYNYYGVENGKSGYLASDVAASVDGSAFSLRFPDGETLSLRSRLIGRHNVLNILAAAAMADKLGVERKSIARAVQMLEPVPHRLELVDGGDIVIIDDAFNSNPAGAKSALEALAVFDGVRILVTPGMVELGESQGILNREFGAKAAEVCQYIYIVGKVNYDSIYRGAALAGFDVGARVIAVDRPEQAVAAVRALATDKKKYVLLENDLPDNFR